MCPEWKFSPNQKFWNFGTLLTYGNSAQNWIPEDLKQQKHGLDTTFPPITSAQWYICANCAQNNIFTNITFRTSKPGHVVVWQPKGYNMGNGSFFLTDTPFHRAGGGAAISGPWHFSLRDWSVGSWLALSTGPTIQVSSRGSWKGPHKQANHILSR